LQISYGDDGDESPKIIRPLQLAVLKPNFNYNRTETVWK